MTAPTTIDGAMMTDEQINDLISRLRSAAKIRKNAYGGAIADRIEWEAADAIELLSASKPAPPEGWKLVPVEPCEDSLAAALSFDVLHNIRPKGRSVATALYKAMLSAAPAAPQPSLPVETSEPVGKIVLFGEDLKEVSWTKGRMPPPGTVLYGVTAPSAVVLDDERAANDRHMRFLGLLQIGGCTCLTKTPVLEYHAEDCKYRLAAEIQKMLEARAASPQAKVSQVIAIAEKFIDRAYLRDFKQKLREVATDAQATATQPARTTASEPVAEVTNYRDIDGDLRAGVVFRGKSPAAGTQLYTQPAQNTCTLTDGTRGEWIDACNKSIADDGFKIICVPAADLLSLLTAAQPASGDKQ